MVRAITIFAIFFCLSNACNAGPAEVVEYRVTDVVFSLPRAAKLERKSEPDFVVASISIEGTHVLSVYYGHHPRFPLLGPATSHQVAVGGFETRQYEKADSLGRLTGEAIYKIDSNPDAFLHFFYVDLPAQYSEDVKRIIGSLKRVPANTGVGKVLIAHYVPLLLKAKEEVTIAEVMMQPALSIRDAALISQLYEIVSTDNAATARAVRFRESKLRLILRFPDDKTVYVDLEGNAKSGKRVFQLSPLNFVRLFDAMEKATRRQQTFFEPSVSGIEEK